MNLFTMILAVLDSAETEYVEIKKNGKRMELTLSRGLGDVDPFDIGTVYEVTPDYIVLDPETGEPFDPTAAQEDPTGGA